MKSLVLIVTCCVLPPPIDPLPDIFCKVEGGLTDISVSSVNFSPRPFTATEIFPTAIAGSATTWNTARFSLFAFNERDWLLLPIICNGPLTFKLAETFVVLEVVLVNVTGTVTVSPGLKNLGNAVLITIGSATVIVFSDEPKF